jgi:hypothetical protein
VGERNHRFFIAFLFFNAVIMGYGIWASGAVLRQEVEAQQLFSATFTRDGVRIKATWSVVAQYLLGARTEICMVGIVCVVMGAIVAAFFVYHIALAAGSVTTNESFKWGDLREARERFVWRHNLGERVRAKLAAEVDSARRGGDEKALEEMLAQQADLLAKIGPPNQPPPGPMPPNKYHRGALANLWAVLSPPAPQLKSRGGAAAATPKAE